MPQLNSLSLCARVTLDMHNLNSEGTEGNQQQTRMVHIVDSDGQRQNVNAVSGDMFKHIFVEHLTPALEDGKQPLSDGARQYSPDRVNVDDAFKAAIKNVKEGSGVIEQMLKRCAVTDIAGTLVTEGRAVARKSCVEFGWVVGIPEKTHTEQYFHVKYAPETRAKSAGQEEKGEGTVAGRQAIFHRPANSGVYALICHVELGRIGVNDISRELMISEDDRRTRARAAVQALMATLIKPAGAQRNTQNPHIVACEGIIATSTSYLPAPTMSPLSDDYRTQMESIRDTLNRIAPDCVRTYAFEDLAGAVSQLHTLSDQV
jgi:CRISPR-associated protein Cst2